MAEILIFPVGGVDASITEFLALSLPETLKLPCKVSDSTISLEGVYDIVREQYYSTKLLERLLLHRDDVGTKLLGVAAVDLFIPPLSFVFGEAQFNNPAAIISIHRLQQKFYGLPEDIQLLYQRSEKEAIHELGHSFGLIHCRDFRCVMYLSYSVEDIDLKGRSFCEKCHALLRKGKS
ncbi:MAG: archaemetzincin family Zn-dependent metalloprotease [Candidatus Lindowbacteria bacterium]|nr:archaemetzincin family Zn-dependent metalloprotease [Candidatus Lindowbacteria bacterium]